MLSAKKHVPDGGANHTSHLDFPVAEYVPKDTQRQPQPQPQSSTQTSAGGEEGSRFVQLKAALRGHDYATQVQMLKPDGPLDSGMRIHNAAEKGISGSSGSLPHASTIQKSFGGYDISNVQAHTDPVAHASATAMDAQAYATGNHIAFATGGANLHTAAHEATHVIQQQAGVSFSGGVGKAGDVYEKHADDVADLVVQGKSAEGLLGEMAGGGGPGAHDDKSGPVQMSSMLTPQIAPEDGEASDFAARVAPLGIAEKDAFKLFATARTKLLSGDPRMHTLAGAALGVDGTWPTAELIAEVCGRQARAKGGRPTGFPAVKHLEEWLAKSPRARLIDENKDLFDSVVGRSATYGQRTENQAHRAQFNEHSEPFLGMGWMPGAGVNGEMHGRLMRAEAQLLGQMGKDIDARGATVHPAKGAPLTKTRSDLKHWAGIRERHRGFKPGQAQGYHKTGSAMDLNYHGNPWMAVRSGDALGGEATQSGKRTMAQEAIDVIDRASLWVYGRRAELHIAGRPAGANEAEIAAWAGKVWERFNAASEAVATYFALGYAIDRDAKLAELARENEKLVAAGSEKTDDTAALLQYRSMLGSLPARPQEEALARISASMAKGRPWTKDPGVALAQMGPDLQAVAKVMVRGSVSASPKNVRNPTLGLFDIKKELLEAMMGAGGLYWGGCEFGKAWSGDMMHFDLGQVPSDLK